MAKVLKQFYIRKDQSQKLEALSSKGTSQAEIVRKALDQYFNSNQNQDQ